MDVPTFHPVPCFDFNLDLPREERWAPIFDSFSVQQLKTLKAHAMETLLPYHSILPFIEPVFNIFDATKFHFIEELNYIAKRMDMPLLQVIILQLVYESASACTAGVFEHHGKSYLYRTMDWSMTFLKDVTIQLNVYRDGKQISRAITWLGTVGFFTATNLAENYSVVINYRRTKELSAFDLMGNVKRAALDLYYPICYLVRETIHAKTFDEAQKIFSTTELISPTYITMFSTKKSLILTRDAEGLIDCRRNKLVQTNCDHDKDVPDILYSVQRRKVFGKIADRLKDGPELTLYQLAEMFSVHPILNHETIYIYLVSETESLALIPR